MNVQNRFVPVGTASPRWPHIAGTNKDTLQPSLSGTVPQFSPRPGQSYRGVARFFYFVCVAFFLISVVNFLPFLFIYLFVFVLGCVFFVFWFCSLVWFFSFPPEIWLYLVLPFYLSFGLSFHGRQSMMHTLASSASVASLTIECYLPVVCACRNPLHPTHPIPTPLTPTPNSRWFFWEGIIML